MKTNNNKHSINKSKFVEGQYYDFQVFLLSKLSQSTYQIICFHSKNTKSQVVAVVNQPAPMEPRWLTFPQWAKSDLVSQKIETLPSTSTSSSTTRTSVTTPRRSRPMSSITPITPGRQPSGQPTGQPTGRPALDPNSLPSHLPSPTTWTKSGSAVRQLEKFECGSDAAEKRAFEMKCQKYFNFSEPSLKPEPLEFVFRYGCFSRAFSITTRQIAMTASIR